MRYTVISIIGLGGSRIMKVTSTINLSSSSRGWTGVKKHMEHDPELNHANKDILNDLTKYNRSGTAFPDEVITRRLDNFFGDYVREHDAKAIQNRHPERVYGSVKKYLDGKNKITAVATVGDMENRNELIKQLCPEGSYKAIQIPSSPNSETLVITDSAVAKKFYGVYTEALVNFLKTNYKINGASCYSYFIPGRYSVHVDEAGAPHIHYELYATGKTKKGRPTVSLNQTLVKYAERDTGSHMSGREALKWYRSFNDQYLTRALDVQFKKVYGDRFKGLEFYRKGTKDVGRSMEQVKNIKRQENELKARQQDLEAERQQIAEKAKLVNELEKGITKIADEIDPQRPPISPAEELVLVRGPESYGKWNEEKEQHDFLPYVFTWLKEFAKKLKGRWEEIVKREKTLDEHEKTLNEREKALNTREKSLTKQEEKVQKTKEEIAECLDSLGQSKMAQLVRNNADDLGEFNGKKNHLSDLVKVAIEEATTKQLRQAKRQINLGLEQKYGKPRER